MHERSMPETWTVKVRHDGSPNIPIQENEMIENNYHTAKMFDSKPKSATNLYRVSKKIRHQSVNIAAAKNTGALMQNFSGSIADRRTQVGSIATLSRKYAISLFRNKEHRWL